MAMATVLGAIVVAWRAYLMLGPARGAGPPMAAHFIVLAATPFLVLTRDDRRAIGLPFRMPASWAAIAVAAGTAAGLLFGVLGLWFYGDSPLNWFATVRDTMLADPRLRALDKPQLFLALSLPAAIFSPIGEELFFRGVLARLWSAATDVVVASVLVAGTFGVMHAFHHGIVSTADGFDVQVVSGLIWVVLTSALSIMFAWLSARSATIWTAVACHAAFNVTMVAFIVIVLI
jgi:membrane protease YdiL (CAAX protease family)